MIKKIALFIYVVLPICFGSTAVAQSGSGSSFLDNGNMTLSKGTSDVVYSEKLYLGPNTNWVIDGDLYLYSKQVWIAPTAKITGTGRIILKDPGVNPYYQDWANQPTLIDGNNGTFIGVTLVIDNASNIKLSKIADPGFGLPSADLEKADLKVAANIDFNTKGGDILLGGYQLYLDENAQLLNAGNSSNLGQYINGFVVTGNNPESMLIKRMKRGTKFLFPIGIDENSYTPALLSPYSNVDMKVGVVDYTNSKLEFEDKTIGMDRVWKIVGSEGTDADYTLVHQSMTNGSAYVDSKAEIMQYAGSKNWIGDVTKLESVGVHTRTDIVVSAIQTAEAIWATKLNADGPQAIDDNFELTYADSYPNRENVFNILLNDIPGKSPLDPGSVQITKQPTNGSVVVNVDGTVTYTPNPGFVGTEVFEYSVSDYNGRSSIATVTIVVKARDLFIPNVFTPNGDGKNDYFEIIGIENYDRVDLIVVNRWGNEVYRMQGYNNKWEGIGLNEGTYFYIIEAQKGGTKRVFKGDVLIKRN